MTVDSLATGGFAGLTDHQAFGFILWQNSRVLLIAFFLSAISFGVAAYILVPPVFVVLGYLASQMIPAGLGTVLAAAIIPHGVIEIPMTILATAAMFKLGSIVTKPPKNATVGHAWLVTLGSALKIGLGVVLPGLILAALLEAYVTFPILHAVMQGLGA
jgi:stage II sporulation protein M